MAYWIQETGGNKNSSLYREYYCDTRDDIWKLPTSQNQGQPQEGDTISSSKCASGSKAFVISDSSVWILKKDTDTWSMVGKQYTVSSGGEGGDGVTDYNDLENRPITNLAGTLSSPIVLSSLPSGLYRVRGNYYITNDKSGTCFINASGSNLYAVSKEDSVISKIGANTISIYSLLPDGKYKEDSIQSTSQIIETIKNDLSDTYVAKNNLKSEIDKYMADNETLISIVDKRVSESFTAISEEEINDLFNYQYT